MTEKNTYIEKSGSGSFRRCLTCMKKRKKLWRKTPTGRISVLANKKLWNKSAAGKAARKAWKKTTKGIEYKARYEKSQNGFESRKRRYKRWVKTEGGRQSEIARRAGHSRKCPKEIVELWKTLQLLRKELKNERK